MLQQVKHSQEKSSTSVTIYEVQSNTDFLHHKQIEGIV
jgi:hypothetical protein